MPRRRKHFFSRLTVHPALMRLGSRVKSPFGRLLSPLATRLRKFGLMESVIRFVLTIGDDGATLVQMQGGEVVDAVFVGPETEDGLGTLHSYLSQDPRAQLIVAADVLEQMYREEQMPKVGRFDRSNVMKRRLDVAFPQDRIKAAMPLAGGKVLFASLPETEAVKQWVEFFEALPNPIVGFCLMPLESAGLASELAPPANPQDGQVWRVLVSQQATSGFRQIFETDGRMVVTRLAQRPSAELSAQTIAQLIERELRSSISYVKRLGYSEQDRLDLIVLAEPEVCKAVDERDLPISSLTAYTPYQAGLLLGLGEVAPEDSGLSDVLHARWLANKRRPLLTLPTDPLRDRLAFDRVFKVGFAMAAGLSLFAIADLVSLAFDAFDTTTTIDVLAQQLTTERQAIESTKAKLASFDVPLEDVLLVDPTADNLRKNEVAIDALLQRVAGALGPDAVIDKIHYRVPSLVIDSAAPPGGPQPTTAPKLLSGRGAAAKPQEIAYELSLVVHFEPSPASPLSPLERAKEMQGRLDKLFPDHVINAVHVPASSLRNQVVENLPSAQSQQKSGPPTAEFLIQRKG